jgi:hypothetical protein
MDRLLVAPRFAGPAGVVSLHRPTLPGSNTRAEFSRRQHLPFFDAIYRFRDRGDQISVSFPGPLVLSP